jgi:ribosomal-protein-alanine N-acetyltransferase
MDAAGRVYLRPPGPDDREEFLTRVRQSRMLHRPWDYPPRDDEAFLAYLERCGTSIDASLVCRREDDAIAGVMNLSNIVLLGFRSAALGYRAFEPFAGQGYLAEGLHLVLRRAFGELRLHRLEANIQPGNTRSIALVKAAGFRLEGYSPRFLKIGGRWQDHERWAILAEDLRGVQGARRRT